MIDFDAFVDWCEKHFDSPKVTDHEVKLNSIFDPNENDHKHKLWCSPSGGKEHREDGVYHCWISGRKGTLVGLVMHVENCGYEEAKELLGGDRSLAAMEAQLEAIFNQKKPEPEPEPEPVLRYGLQLPPGVILITSLYFSDRRRTRAEAYLWGRKIPPQGFFLGISDIYRDRIVIPYYDRQGTLIYYNGRHLWKDTPKYLGPPKEAGVGKGDVVYMPHWPDAGEPLYITEGEFDAFTLHLCSLNAAAVGGSAMTWEQIKILRNFRLILAVDNDDAGQSALLRMGSELRENGIYNLHFIRPPVGIKDWNEFLNKCNHTLVLKYATEKTKPYDGILL